EELHGLTFHAFAPGALDVQDLGRAGPERSVIQEDRARIERPAHPEAAATLPGTSGAAGPRGSARPTKRARAHPDHGRACAARASAPSPPPCRARPAGCG